MQQTETAQAASEVMQSKSGPQHRLMAMVAYDPAAAKRTGVPQSVGREFIDADKAAGKHFAMSNDVDEADSPARKAIKAAKKKRKR